MDKKRIDRIINKEILKAVDQLLTLTEVALPSYDQYKRLRGKVLRIFNDCIRSLQYKINDGLLLELQEFNKELEARLNDQDRDEDAKEPKEESAGVGETDGGDEEETRQ